MDLVKDFRTFLTIQTVGSGDPPLTDDGCVNRVEALLELRSRLSESCRDGTTKWHIHFQHVPQFDPSQDICEDIHPFIWYRLAGIDHDRCLTECYPRPSRLTLDVEIVAPSPGDMSILSSLLVQSVDSYTGDFGDTCVQDIMVESQDTGYESPNQFGDWGLHVMGLNIDVYPLWEEI